MPMECGLRWLPQWSASSVVAHGNRLIAKARELTPFHRMIWDLFSVKLWETLKKSPCDLEGDYDCTRSMWPFQPRYLAWTERYIFPLYSDFHRPRVVVPQRGEDDPDDHNLVESEREIGRLDPNSRYVLSARHLMSLLAFSQEIFCEKCDNDDIGPSGDSVLAMCSPGRLGFKDEGAGKAFSISRSLRSLPRLSRLFFCPPMIGVLRSCVQSKLMVRSIKLHLWKGLRR